MNVAMRKMSYESEIQEVISSGKILNVLIVDDSNVIRCAIREILEIGNIQVTEASDGEEALKSVRKNVPDLVLLDVVMPEINGITVLKKLRKSYSKLQLPIVMVTSRDSAQEVVQALDYGANDYITKPIDFDILWARLSNQLMQKQAAEFLRLAKIRLEKQIKQRTEELKLTNLQLEKEIEVRTVAESELQKQASYDGLTGLPNRSLASDRLTQTLVKAKRHTLNPCLAFIDLDNFKYVNDTFGHSAGDDLLREAARRLLECARGSDTVARLGGDEFLLILDDDDNLKTSDHEIAVRHVAERILESFSKPFNINGQDITITPSLGFSVYPKDGEDEDTLMRHADAAMYRSKNEGKNTYCFYSPEMTVKAKLRVNVETQLRHALERKELSLHYQPIIDAETGKIIKAEALLRWNSKELGMIMPDYFIPIAEETGLILPIGDWVITSVCKQLKEWRNLGWDDLCITVNVSARQLHADSSLIDTLTQSLKNSGLPTNAIQFELKEGVFLEDTSHLNTMIQTLENKGIKLHMDDFGSGYASLSCIKRHSFDSIKIDCNIIMNLVDDIKNKKFVTATIAMAKSLGIHVISKGVETKKQLQFLQNVQCELIQGNYFSKPVTSDQFIKLLKHV
ncbi:MAG: EAL domain-containing protein [Gammaproteobacteria bacterium]|nr:EAL domain-containing protein [Gammaproteobacteria bacterium]